MGKETIKKIKEKRLLNNKIKYFFLLITQDIEVLITSLAIKKENKK